jgi:hypothetical protein
MGKGEEVFSLGYYRSRQSVDVQVDRGAGDSADSNNYRLKSRCEIGGNCEIHLGNPYQACDDAGENNFGWLATDYHGEWLPGLRELRECGSGRGRRACHERGSDVTITRDEAKERLARVARRVWDSGPLEREDPRRSGQDRKSERGNLAVVIHAERGWACGDLVRDLEIYLSR